jgi:uncharacterized LabA/DUF88 family protein
MIRTAVLVDGGFYRKRAVALWGQKTPEGRAFELVRYCTLHLKEKHEHEKHSLYRIFYYDCPPIAKQIYHPLLKRAVDLSKSAVYQWANSFHSELKKKRKIALRFGSLAEDWARYTLPQSVIKKLFEGTKQLSDITENDFVFTARQKGVDMKIGIDIASLAYKKLVDQIVLIAGDSDFVPVAKLARREGIDFILDPIWSNISPLLFEHIDGLRSFRFISEQRTP